MLRELFTMKTLGRGWQYTVYDLKNRRVLKRLNSPFATYSVMLRDSFPYIHHPLWNMPRLYEDAKKAAISSIQKIKHNTLEPWMLANPAVLSDSSYEQDKVIPLLPSLHQFLIKYKFFLLVFHNILSFLE